MPRGSSTFRQTDVKRAVQAAEATGKKVQRVELELGKITVIFADDSPAAKNSANEWDTVK